MAIKLSQLPSIFRALPVYFIGDSRKGRIATIDGKQNSTGRDIVLLFSSKNLAVNYRNHYPSLKGYGVISGSVQSVIELLNGRVEYFIVDRPPSDPRGSGRVTEEK